MKKILRNILPIILVLLLMIPYIRISHAEEQDIYTGSYDIESIISQYNIVTFADLKTMTHIVGPVLVQGDFGEPGIEIHHSQNTAGVSSFIKGKVLASGTAVQNANDKDYGNPNLYVGTVNTVSYYDYNHGGVEVFIREGEHVNVKDYKVNSFEWYTKYPTVRTNNYIDFSLLKSKIIAQQAILAEGNTVTPDANGVITIRGGTISTIKTLSGVNKIVFEDFDVFQEDTTVVNILQGSSVTMPLLINGRTGSEFSTSDFAKEDGKYKNVNLVWSLPNATSLNLKQSPFIGHLIAPKADVDLPQMNFAGCFLVNSLDGVRGTEAHYYPYGGSKLQVKSEKEEEGSYTVKLVKESTDGTKLPGVEFSVNAKINGENKVIATEDEPLVTKSSGVDVGSEVTINKKTIDTDDVYTLKEINIGESNKEKYYLGIDGDIKVNVSKQSNETETKIINSIKDVSLDAIDGAELSSDGKTLTFSNGSKVTVTYEDGVVTIVVVNPEKQIDPGSYKLQLIKEGVDGKILSGVEFTANAVINGNETVIADEENPIVTGTSPVDIVSNINIDKDKVDENDVFTLREINVGEENSDAYYIGIEDDIVINVHKVSNSTETMITNKVVDATLGEISGAELSSDGKTLTFSNGAKVVLSYEEGIIKVVVTNPEKEDDKEDGKEDDKEDDKEDGKEDNKEENTDSKTNNDSKESKSVKTGDEINMYFYMAIAGSIICILCKRRESKLKYRARHRK